MPISPFWIRRRRTATPAPPGPPDPPAAPAQDGDDDADETTAELSASYWRAYHHRMATTSFLSIARQFPALVSQALRLGLDASRRDLIATVSLNLASGVLSGYALFATTGVLEALFAAGPTPDRVRAALPSLALVGGATAARAGLSAAAGWAQARLEPQVGLAVELRLYELTTRVELSAFDDASFQDALTRAENRSSYAAAQVVSNVINCLTSLAGLVSTAVVIAVLNPLLLGLLVLAELPGAWAAIRSARIQYTTDFALADSRRRRYSVTWLMADRRTAAELRSFTMRGFLLARTARLLAYERAAELTAARQQALTQLLARAAGGVATAGVYLALGLLLAGGVVPLAVAGTAVLAIRSAQSSLAALLFAVNQCYEEGLYFSDYLAFCADAERRIRTGGPRPAPPAFRRITAEHLNFSYPEARAPALCDVSIEIGHGEVVALVGENGSGKTTLAKILAGLYQPDAGAVRWDGEPASEMDPDELRERIAVIAQDHAHWPLTARHNITMGRPLDEARLAAAAAAAGADTVISGLPRGWHTLLARQFKDGAELSGGQWQRVAVARGFYRAAPLLIMDEPTAALDARAEYALFSSVREHARGRSILIITHRLASVRHADRIYVLCDGQVTEQGGHDALLAAGGLYAELYRLQASQYGAA